MMRVNAEPALVRGFRFSGVSAGIKTTVGAKDLGLIVADAPAAATAVFSANRVKAAPVYVTMDRIRAGRLQAVVANSGCANSFTGKPGLKLVCDYRERNRMRRRVDRAVIDRRHRASVRFGKIRRGCARGGEGTSRRRTR